MRLNLWKGTLFHNQMLTYIHSLSILPFCTCQWNFSLIPRLPCHALQLLQIIGPSVKCLSHSKKTFFEWKDVWCLDQEFEATVPDCLSPVRQVMRLIKFGIQEKLLLSFFDTKISWLSVQKLRNNKWLNYCLIKIICGKVSISFQKLGQIYIEYLCTYEHVCGLNNWNRRNYKWYIHVCTYIVTLR